MTYKIAHEIHPNNETRLTLYKVRGVFSSLKERAALALGAPLSEVVEQVRNVPDSPPLLDIRSEFRTDHQTDRKNTHARTSFGKAAITRIFRAGGAMDRFDATRSNYLFLTATLPGDTDEAKWAIAEYAHEIIDGLKSWFSKRFLDRKEFYVWENQKRGALHFHYCIYCPDSGIQADITANFKAQMVRLYDGIAQKHNCNLWGKYASLASDAKASVLQARVEVVYGSVGAYMAGYFTGKSGKHSGDAHHNYYPKRWYGVSRPLSTLIESYTEKEQHEFESFSEASEFYCQKREEILDEALTSREFRHKVGEGKTTTAYHTPEKQKELWQAKKMLIHRPTTHPRIAHFISSALTTTRELQRLSKRFKCWGESLPPNLRLFLLDSTSMISMRNGALSLRSIRDLEKMYSCLDFSSHSSPEIRRCFPSLQKFNLMAAKYHPQMRFNPQGWLSNERDFMQVFDKTILLSYVGTNTEDGGAPVEPIPASGHVPRAGGSSFIQLEF